METKVRDANVVVPINDSDGYDEDKFIPVALTEARRACGASPRRPT